MKNAKNKVTTEDLYEAQKFFSEMTYQYWVEHVLFTFNWWFLISLMIVPWFFWWRVVDRKRIFEMLTIGLFASLIATCLDTVGIVLLLWGYESKVVQMIPQFNPIDYTVIPVIFTLIYQYFPRWKSYLLVHTIVAAGASFIVEPLFVWMEIYEPYNWKYVYSFPIYIVLAVGVKSLIEKLKFQKKDLPSPRFKS
jgi:hypothetical protein